MLFQAGHAYNRVNGVAEDEEERLVQQPSSSDAHADHGHGAHFDFGEVRAHARVHAA